MEIDKDKLEAIRKIKPQLKDQEIINEALTRYLAELEKEDQALRITHSLSIREDIWNIIDEKAKKAKLSRSRYVEMLAQKYQRTE